MFKKHKKNVLAIGDVAMTSTGLSLGLGALGSTAGVQGVSNATRFLPVTGTMVGLGLQLDVMKKLTPKNKKF